MDTFSRLPARALAGQAVTVAVARARPSSQCSLAVTYGNLIAAGSTYALGNNLGDVAGELINKNGGFRDIPFQQAASAMVSAIPTWQSGTA